VGRGGGRYGLEIILPSRAECRQASGDAGDRGADRRADGREPRGARFPAALGVVAQNTAVAARRTRCAFVSAQSAAG
jgi:hypothetical protein